MSVNLYFHPETKNILPEAPQNVWNTEAISSLAIRYKLFHVTYESILVRHFRHMRNTPDELGDL